MEETKQEVTQEVQSEQEILQQPSEIAPEIKSEANVANWRAFREQREAERKARIEIEKKAAEKAAEAEALRKALEAVTSKPNTYEEYSEESEDEKIEKKVRELLEKKEQELLRQRHEEEIKNLPVLLNREFKDFDQVCSTENLDYLEYHYPEIAAPFKYMPDGFEKWAAIYKATKKLVKNTTSAADAAKLQKNLEKPKSISSTNLTSSGQSYASVVSEAKKAANWERMQRTMKGLTP